MNALSAEARPQAEQFIRFLQSLEPIPVDRAVLPAETLPWCGGIDIVHTPGHMPGHISLYLPASKRLIAGDAVVIEAGKLDIANPHYTLDLEAAVRSVEALLDYDIEHLLCYHGGRYHGDIRQALQQLVHTYKS